MLNQFSRTQLTLGKENMTRLASCHVAVFGIGGVGGYVVEALVRSGIGTIDLIDNDKVALTNLNRQIIALHSTIGRSKVDVAEERIHDINPECIVYKHNVFFTPQTSAEFDFGLYDYAVDCIDTVSGKIEIIMKAKDAGIPVISSMGAGNKLDPTMLEVADIYKTSVCPLARVMRREMKIRGVKHLKVVYSREKVTPPQYDEDDYEGCKEKNFCGQTQKPVAGSNAFVPTAAGLIIASEVIRDLTGMSPSVQS